MEATQIAQTVVEMLLVDPPEVPQVRRIRGEDICIIANFTGQILEIRRQVAQLAQTSGVKQDDINNI
jgi:hypothetical protein